MSFFLGKLRARAEIDAKILLKTLRLWPAGEGLVTDRANAPFN
jgi:hypothetical protein